MKFTNYLKDIDHVSIYPVLSLILFTVVFLFVIVYVFSSDKSNMEDKANIPLK